MFWIGIIIAAVFAVISIKQGLFAIWMVFFNALISIYLGICLEPIISGSIPALSQMAFGSAITIAVLAVVIFAIFYMLAFTVFLNQFSITFPKLIDILGSAGLGFAAALLVWCFLSFLVCMTPFSESSFAKSIAIDRKSQQKSISYLGSCCNLIHNFAGSEKGDDSITDTVNKMIDRAHKKKLKKRRPSSESAKYDPNDPNDSNDITESDSEPNL